MQMLQCWRTINCQSKGNMDSEIVSALLLLIFGKPGSYGRSTYSSREIELNLNLKTGQNIVKSGDLKK